MDIPWEPHSYLIVRSLFSHSKNEIKLQCYGMFKNNSALHRELYLMLRGSMDGKGGWGRRDAHIGKAESLCSPSEIITTLVINNQRYSILEKHCVIVTNPVHF